jgi:F-type H+-transporting ATPase subunit b
MTLAFGVVFFVLKKFVWPPIMQALNEREQHIEEALQAADLAHEEMKKLKLDNEQLLREAKEERDAIMAEARKIKDKMLDDARLKANQEADRIVESAKERIHHERLAAMTEMKNQIAEISIEVAERLLREKLSAPKAQQEYIDRLLNEKQLN